MELEFGKGFVLCPLIETRSGALLSNKYPRQGHQPRWAPIQCNIRKPIPGNAMVHIGFGPD